jgi:hypothetical protein
VQIRREAASMLAAASAPLKATLTTGPGAQPDQGGSA